MTSPLIRICTYRRCLENSDFDLTCDVIYIHKYQLILRGRTPTGRRGARPLGTEKTLDFFQGIFRKIT